MNKDLRIPQLYELYAKQKEELGFVIHSVGDLPGDTERDFPPGFCNVHTHGLQQYCGYEIQVIRYFEHKHETIDTCVDIIQNIGNYIVQSYDYKCNYNINFASIFNAMTHSVYAPVYFKSIDNKIPFEFIGHWIYDPEDPHQLRIVRPGFGQEYMQCCPVSAILQFYQSAVNPLC